MADSMQLVRVTGFIVSQLYAMVVKRPEVTTPAPKATLG